MAITYLIPSVLMNEIDIMIHQRYLDGLIRNKTIKVEEDNTNTDNNKDDKNNNSSRFPYFQHFK